MLIAHRGQELGGLNPFFAILPTEIMLYAVILATFASIIASQSLISGSFTLVSEAIRLKLLPMLKIYYPGETLGQLYIPAVNFALWIVTSCIVLYFKTSAHMEAAYGLAITVTMLMTSILLSYYLIQKGLPHWLAHGIMSFFILIEGMFFVASAIKFLHGGYVVVIIALMIMFVMYIWHHGNSIVFKYIKSLNINDYKRQLKALRDDTTIDLYQTNVVYLTSRMDHEWIDRSILYSILDKTTKTCESVLVC